MVTENEYAATLDFLYNQLPMFQNIGAGAYKPGLEGVTALSDAFGSPHRGLRCIHVAGTNGKGSTASTIAAVLTSAGYRTGLYTSPHLVDFRERIRIDGDMITKDEVVDFIKRYRAMTDLVTAQSPSFFELTTVMAFEHFKRNAVDVAVIEVGLGGRLDSTNIISPDLSIITNISLDHTALLGDTPAQIASEKAGIIKPGIPVVIGEAEGDVRRVFADKAAQAGAPLTFACDNPMYTHYRQVDGSITYYGTPWGDIVSPLCGDCQPHNAATAMAALHILEQREWHITPQAVVDGFADVCRLTGLTGRWTTLSTSPLTICDTGHNPGGWQYLSAQLQRLAESHDTLHIVLGFAADKDIAGILAMLPRMACYHWVCPSVRRGMDAADLQHLADMAGLHGTAHASVAQGYTAAISLAGSDDAVFVGGSNFVVADLLACLEEAQSNTAPQRHSLNKV